MARSLCLILVFAAVSAFADTTNAPSRKLVVQSFSLNQYAREFDGQWQGITVASDGNCYFGASSHSDKRGAGFFRYNPRTKELTVLADDISRVCGENPPRAVPQGKLHSPIVEANGWLYLSTHLGCYTSEGKQNYPGAHILGYELATGKFRDYGVLRKRFSVYSAIGVDSGRRCLHAFVMPLCPDDVRHGGAHLYRLDLRTGRKTDLGMVKPGPSEFNGSFWFFVDARGDCWFTMGRENGTLFRARARTGKIERWNDVLPRAGLAPQRESSLRQFDRHWTWAQALPGRERCAFTMGLYEYQREPGRHVFYGDEQLWLFDPRKNIENGDAFQRVGYLGPNFLGVALGGNRVYCVQPTIGTDSSPAIPPPITTRSFQRRVPPVFLRSLPLDAPENALPADHGQIVDQDGRVALSSEAIAADSHARVYMVADFSLLPGEKSLLRFHERTKTYREENRGMFFAVAEVE